MVQAATSCGYTADAALDGGREVAEKASNLPSPRRLSQTTSRIPWALAIALDSEGSSWGMSRELREGNRTEIMPILLFCDSFSLSNGTLILLSYERRGCFPQKPQTTMAEQTGFYIWDGRNRGNRIPPQITHRKSRAVSTNYIRGLRNWRRFLSLRTIGLDCNRTQHGRKRVC